ncbi:MAG: sigma-54-dependent Fis family transcriptional regulator [Holophagales bacterium]|nr:sigma-54-dependent Fis family transcriptional regulator [Holophagales bacterium]
MRDIDPPASVRRPESVLRRLIRAEYLTVADWDVALGDTARMAREASGADEALVAIFQPAPARWTAVTSGGESLADKEISLVASLSVLESVLESGEPIRATAGSPVLSRSLSASRNLVSSVVAVPLRFSVAESRSDVRVGGCLYADRRNGEPFTEEDAENLLDIARLTERTLNALAHLRHLQRLLAEAEQRRRHHREEEVVAREVDGEPARDPAFLAEVVEPLRRAAKTGGLGVLLLGPTGSGKSHLARLFHEWSPRRDRPFVVFDCGQVTSAEAIGAELFGYAKKSGFSAPVEGRPGRARLADGGTLFIDEVATLPLELQQRLLRLLQTGRFSPLGSGVDEAVDLQIVAAANQDLQPLIRSGAFREDLYWRLAELEVHVPPLSSRPLDIAPFARRFLKDASRRLHRASIEGFTPEALAALETHDWSRSGNVRGLEHAVRRSVLLAPPDRALLDVGDLVIGRGLPQGSSPPAPPAPDALASLLMARIAEHRGVLARVAEDADVARALGYPGPPVPASTLLLRIRACGIEEALERSRRADDLDVSVLVEAVRRTGSGTAAAEHLGITRDSLAWTLRRAGLSIRKVLQGNLP